MFFLGLFGLLRNFAHWLVVVGVLFTFRTTPACAESQLTPERRKVIELTAKSVAKEMGIGEGSPLWIRFLDKSLNRSSDIKPYKNLPVVKHLRGKDGSPFTIRNVPASDFNAKLESFNKARHRRTKAKATKRRQDGFAEFITPEALGACSRNLTHRIENFDQKPGPKGLRFDLLYLPAKSVSSNDRLADLDFHETFGIKTTIHPYSTRKGDLISLQAKKYGAQCLPFRIRVTDKYIFFHSGPDALNNYDFDIEGKGKMHPFIQRELKRFFTP